MKIRFIYLIILIFLINGIGNAQDDPDAIYSVIPPQPDAAAFEKITNIPVSHFTGLPQINIPLLTLEGNPIDIPLSLSYHASGIKVSEVPGWVGANWTLNVGGIISRTVRGGADDKITTGYLTVASAVIHNLVLISL